MTQSSFPNKLQGDVWHTTSYERYQQIQRDGQILANPNIPDSERWKTCHGPDFYPYVRTLGGVSLFEFIKFDPASYEKKYPLSSWRKFIPYCFKWDKSVWLEFDVSTLKKYYIPGSELFTRWKDENAHFHSIMPFIEDACLAPIPISSIRRVLESSSAEPKLKTMML